MPNKPTNAWDRKSQYEKLASVLYPNHASDEERKLMGEIAGAAGKKPPSSPLLDHQSRGSVSPLGGTARRA